MSQHAGAPERKYSRKTRNVTNSKENALSDREFELLVEGTYSMDSYFDLEARLIIYIGGRLGMRVGEIVHMKEHWIDWRRQMIEIPKHEPCDKARDGDSICGYCRQNLKQLTGIRTKWKLDEIYAEDLNVFEPGNRVTPEAFVDESEMEDHMWNAKTEAAAREIPFDAEARAEIALERYFDRFDEFKTSKSGVNRRINRAAEYADELEPDDIHPHGLRSTAASYWAARGLGTIPLQAMFGWSEMSVAKRYVASSGERTARAVRNI
jgi:integrase